MSGTHITDPTRPWWSGFSTSSPRSTASYAVSSATRIPSSVLARSVGLTARISSFSPRLSYSMMNDMSASITRPSSSSTRFNISSKGSPSSRILSTR